MFGDIIVNIINDIWLGLHWGYEIRMNYRVAWFAYSNKNNNVVISMFNTVTTANFGQSEYQTIIDVFDELQPYRAYTMPEVHMFQIETLYQWGIEKVLPVDPRMKVNAFIERN